MDLGKATLRRNGTNYLQNALHHDHGMVWTDGKNIFQAPVHLYRDQVESAASTRLGEFERVHSVHWNCGLDPHACFMAAVHPKSVSVWQVSGTAPRLAFKQVRKINIETLPQGCLWNPKYTDITCLLNRQQVSFFFKHSQQDRGHVSFPKLEQGRISCGCWSADGHRLVACVGTVLLIYTWPDLNASVRDCVQTAWRIPGISPSVSISCVVPASNDCFMCSSSLPLEVLCKNNNKDSFIVPAVAHAAQASADSAGIIHTPGVPSVKDSLFNLQPNPNLAQMQDASATLTLLQMRAADKDPEVVATANVPGLVSPDILHFQMESQCVIVGSNMQNTLLVFALLDSHLLPTGNIVLDKSQRPKGIGEPDASLINTSYGVLVLIGSTEPTDATFPSKDNTSEFSLSLQFFPTRPEKMRQLLNGHGTSSQSASSAVSLAKSESLREQSRSTGEPSYIHTRQASYKGERPDHRLRSPERQGFDDHSFRLSLSGIDSGETHSKLVEELTSDSPRDLEVAGVGYRALAADPLEIHSVEFSQSSPQFQNTKLLHQYELGQIGLTQSQNNATHGTPSGNGQSGNGSDRDSVDGSSFTHLVPSQLLETSVSLGNVSKDRLNRLSGTRDSESLVSQLTSSHLPETGNRNSPTTIPKSIPSPETEPFKDRYSPLVRPKYSQLSDHSNSSATTPSSSRSFETRRASKDSMSSSVSSGQSTYGAEKGEQLARTYRVSVDKLRGADDPTAGPLSANMPGSGLSPLPRRNRNLDDGGSVCSSITSSDSNYEALEKQIQYQREQIDALQKRLADLSVVVEDTTCVFPVRYQNMSEPEYVSIQCMVRQGARSLHRKFLLDNGRLQLDPVKQAFGLLTVELIIDGEALVLGSNIDGYVPMKFSPGSTLQVTGIPLSAIATLPPELVHKAFPEEAVGNAP